MLQQSQQRQWCARAMVRNLFELKHPRIIRLVVKTPRPTKKKKDVSQKVRVISLKLGEMYLDASKKKMLLSQRC